jgi:hypothetical protein
MHADRATRLQWRGLLEIRLGRGNRLEGAALQVAVRLGGGLPGWEGGLPG